MSFQKYVSKIWRIHKKINLRYVTEKSYASQQSCSVHIYFLWNRFWVSVMRVSNKSRIIWVSFPDLPQEKCYQVDYLSWERYSSTRCFSEFHDIVVYILYVYLLLVNGIKNIYYIKYLINYKQPAKSCNVHKIKHLLAETF